MKVGVFHEVSLPGAGGRPGSGSDSRASALALSVRKVSMAD